MLHATNGLQVNNGGFFLVCFQGKTFKDSDNVCLLLDETIRKSPNKGG